MATTPTDPLASLTGDQRDAAVALTSLFTSYGLATLAPQIIKFLQQGFSADTIAVELQDTKEYKQRFAANDARLKAGLPVLSPADYVSTETAYRQVMSAAGLPIGFYDSASDFQKFLENDVSPTEVKSRVDAVSDAIYNAPPETTNFFKQWYTTGDMIAYALDPKVATPLIEQRIRAAEAGAVASGQGLNLSKTNAELIGRQNGSLASTQQGLGFIAQEQPTTDKLGQIYGIDETQSDLVKEVFTSDGAAANKRKTLASRERASFAGSSAQGKTSLSTNGASNV
jgi:hypothetical protein